MNWIPDAGSAGAVSWGLGPPHSCWPPQNGGQEEFNLEMGSARELHFESFLFGHAAGYAGSQFPDLGLNPPPLGSESQES